MTPARVALTLILSLLSAAAVAAERKLSAPHDPSSDWSLDMAKVKPAPGRKASRNLSAEDAEKAARLAEGRRRFFEARPEPEKPVPEFGGYNAGVDSGNFRPGAAFKF